VAPETPDSYQNGAQAPCRESVKNEKWKCQKLEGNLASEGKMLINTQENVKSASEFFVGSGRARGSPSLAGGPPGTDFGTILDGCLVIFLQFSADLQASGE
jgi:hypothetical protein